MEISIHSVTRITKQLRRWSDFSIIKFTALDNRGQEVEIQLFCDGSAPTVIIDLPDEDARGTALDKL